MADRRRKPSRSVDVKGGSLLFCITFATSLPATFGCPQCLPVHLLATHEFLLQLKLLKYSVWPEEQTRSQNSACAKTSNSRLVAYELHILSNSGLPECVCMCNLPPLCSLITAFIIFADLLNSYNRQRLQRSLDKGSGKDKQGEKKLKPPQSAIRQWTIKFQCLS